MKPFKRNPVTGLYDVPRYRIIKSVSGSELYYVWDRQINDVIYDDKGVTLRHKDIRVLKDYLGQRNMDYDGRVEY